MPTAHVPNSCLLCIAFLQPYARCYVRDEDVYRGVHCSAVLLRKNFLNCAGDKPGWLKLAWQYLRRPRLDPLTMIGENRSVMGFNLIHMFEKVDELGRLVDELQALNLPAPAVGECFAFQDAQDALRKLQSGATTGKVVLIVEHEEAGQAPAE